MDANMLGGPEGGHARPAPGAWPRVGVAAVVQRHGRVLVGRRVGAAHGRGHWQLPGGHLEPFEHPFACAEREVLEETGLRVRAMHAGPWSNDVFVTEQRHYVTVFVLTEPVDATAEPTVREPDKCAEWRWCAWDALPAPLFAPLASLRAAGWTPPAHGGSPAGRAPDPGDGP
jgi:8-oxo-dGTP diphosphatase